MKEPEVGEHGALREADPVEYERRLATFLCALGR